MDIMYKIYLQVAGPKPSSMLHITYIIRTPSPAQFYVAHITQTHTHIPIYMCVYACATCTHMRMHGWILCGVCVSSKYNLAVNPWCKRWRARVLRVYLCLVACANVRCVSIHVEPVSQVSVYGCVFAAATASALLLLHSVLHTEVKLRNFTLSL